MAKESVFTWGAPGLKFGTGASHELAWEVTSRGARRVLLVTDPQVAATGHPARISDQLHAAGVEVITFTDVHTEPTDASVEAAVQFARDVGLGGGIGSLHLVLAVGGGSVIDTAKAVNLLLTNPGDLTDYLNAPLGRARAPQYPLLPLIAVPTTAGTGSESTTVCVLDVVSLALKTGISHPALRPTLAVVDPDLTLTQPALVTASSGLDILCHALESWTARPYRSFEAKSPQERVPYCGANPISDVWASQALSLLAGALRAAVRDGSDLVAREQLALAATFAGMGFGNAGVHIPHANGYPIAGKVKDYRPAGYPGEGPLVPHGMAVALTAPAAFAFTFEADPTRHLQAAVLLGSDDSGPQALPDAIRRLMHDIDMPNGLAEIGYGPADVDDLVEGALLQQRLLAGAPCTVRAEDLAGIFEHSWELW